jgi:hypothetical protein
MHHSENDYEANYADDIMSSAQPIGSQLGVGSGFLGVLLITMSAIEAPAAPGPLSTAVPVGGRGTLEDSSWLMRISEKSRPFELRGANESEAALMQVLPQSASAV